MVNCESVRDTSMEEMLPEICTRGGEAINPEKDEAECFCVVVYLDLRILVLLVVGRPLQFQDDVDVLDDLIVRTRGGHLVRGAPEVHRVHRYRDVLQPCAALNLLRERRNGNVRPV
jgi:hypothetical protein